MDIYVVSANKMRTERKDVETKVFPYVKTVEIHSIGELHLTFEDGTKRHFDLDDNYMITITE